MDAPCGCKGTMAYAHAECLSDWIRASCSTRCATCGLEYEGVSMSVLKDALDLTELRAAARERQRMARGRLFDILDRHEREDRELLFEIHDRREIEDHEREQRDRVERWMIALERIKSEVLGICVFAAHAIVLILTLVIMSVLFKWVDDLMEQYVHASELSNDPLTHYRFALASFLRYDAYEHIQSVRDCCKPRV